MNINCVTCGPSRHKLDSDGGHALGCIFGDWHITFL